MLFSSISIETVQCTCVIGWFFCIQQQKVQKADKVWMFEEIMTNNDNLESNLLTSSLLKMCCLVQVELEMFTAPVAGDELTRICVQRLDTSI